MKDNKKGKIKILIIVGTVRERRMGRIVADWYLREARLIVPEIDFEIFDVAEQNLPLFNEALAPAQYHYGKIQQRLAKKIGSVDGFIFITGEYNHGIPGSLKNFLDYLGPREWEHKPAAYVGYGAAGAFRAIEQLVHVMAALRVANVANWGDHINIKHIWAAFDENGNPKSGYVEYGDVKTQLKEFLWWVNALKQAREKTYILSEPSKG